METPPEPPPESLPISAPILELGAESAVARERNASGIWSIDGDRLSCIESFDVGPAVVLVPTEDVTILIADLPINGRAKQLAALPFAIEDRIAQPIEDVHVALGITVAPQRFVAGAVRHATMAAWTLRLIDAGLDRAALVPDALALPVPGEGSWAVDLAAGRVLVRAADGTGLALPIALLEHAWRAAGEPRCIAYGDTLPAVFGAPEVAMERAPLAARLLAPALNLRQGRYAAPRAAFNPLWRRIALVAAIGAGAHAAIAAADTLALSRIAADHVATARTLVAAQAPGIALGDDLAASMAEITPASTAAPSAFLPLFARVSSALRPLGSTVTIRSLNFDGAGKSLTVDLEAGDIAVLQRAAAALTAAGLTAEAGAASVDQGKAVGSYIVRTP